MILPYLVRLLCLCLASFFLVHLAIGLAVTLLSPAILRRAEKMTAGNAARHLLLWRLGPWTLSLVAVVGLCAPSYLLLEPAATQEKVGIACLLAALLSVASIVYSAIRCVRAIRRSLGYVRYCQMVGRQQQFAGEGSPVWVVEGSAPFLALAGIMRPLLIISRPVVNALPALQLAAALRHEHAHRLSRDNFKRLLLLLAPDLLPSLHGFSRMERAWARFTEWAADDYAVAGDTHRSLSLASALVSVARMGACPQTAPLVTSLLADNQDLAERVERLLRDVPGDLPQDRQSKPVLATVFICSGLLVTMAMLNPVMLSSVHFLLEHLTR
jgi:hypothetical protein